MRLTLERPSALRDTLGDLPHWVLSHTADTGIEARAGSLADLIVELATGMFETMATVDSPPLDHEIEVEVSGPTPEDLVIEVLSELLYEAETEDLFLCEFAATQVGRRAVRVRARGVPMSDIELSGPPIKAVTYHALKVAKEGKDWHGRVYFDV